MPAAEQKERITADTLGGPVWIPTVLKGRDRTFSSFFLGKKLGYKLGAKNTTTVPTDAMSGGGLFFSGDLQKRS